MSTRHHTGRYGPLFALMVAWIGSTVSAGDGVRFEGRRLAVDLPVVEPIVVDESIACDGCDGSLDDALGRFGNLELFAGIDGSKQPQDFGVNAHLGARASANWAFSLVPEWGLGAQIGTAVHQTDHAVAVTNPVIGSADRTQVFTTAGLFQRRCGWTVGAAYDLLWQDDYDAFTLGQFRGRVGYQVAPCHEVGVFGRSPSFGDRGSWGPVNVRVEPIAQASVYWRRTWRSGAETTCWLGVAEGHGQANAALGDRPAVDEVVVLGADVHVPLDDCWALVGETNLITPADTGTVDAYLGFAFYPGGGAWSARRRRNAAALPVAAPTSFSVDLSRTR